MRPAVVREATLDDAEAVCAVQLAAIRGLAARHYTEEQVRAWTEGRNAEQIRWALARGERIFVAEREGRVVGFSSLLEQRITALYVLPEEAGRGTGGALLAAVEEVARGSGAEEVQLNASLGAVGFYRRHGYEETCRRTQRSASGVELECVGMRKRL